MKKLLNILTGWGKRLGILQISKAEHKMAEVRMSICKWCPYSEQSKVMKILNGNVNYEAQLKCNKCGCPCWEKTIVVDEKCPIDKW
jgi:hypothetical protein